MVIFGRVVKLWVHLDAMGVEADADEAYGQCGQTKAE